MSKGTLLVAGGAGYIGSHFCKMAAEQGYFPVVLDRLTHRSPIVQYYRKKAARWGPLAVADIGDEEQVTRTIKKYNICAAVCFAALIDVAESVAQPELYWNNNFRNAITFFSALQKNGIHKVIFSSSAAVYGQPGMMETLSEDTPLTPINPYGMTKLATEIALQGTAGKPAIDRGFLESFAKQAQGLPAGGSADIQPFFPDLQSVAFRYFNAAGADESGKIGEVHEPETHLIPNTIFASQGRKKLILQGTDYPTPDGTAIRDYVHVNDLARAHLLGFEYLLNGGKSDVFNLGTGKGYSVQEVIDGVKAVTRKDFPIINGPRREGDPAFLVANADKAKRILGWQPQRNLSDMIRSAMHFYRC